MKIALTIQVFGRIFYDKGMNLMLNLGKYNLIDLNLQFNLTNASILDPTDYGINATVYDLTGKWLLDYQ